MLRQGSTEQNKSANTHFYSVSKQKIKIKQDVLFTTYINFRILNFYHNKICEEDHLILRVCTARIRDLFACVLPG